MAQIEVSCPYCRSINTNKYGLSKMGTQRYICQNKGCNRQIFQLSYQYKGRVPGVEEDILRLTANASGIRDTSRVLGVSQKKVIFTLKKEKMR